MYMLTILQLEAYRATHDRKYLDRDAQEMVAYLDKLQQPNGLFNHAAGCAIFLGTRRWVGGRGHGGDAARFATGSSAARAHFEWLQGDDGALLKYQGKDGMWRQLIDHDEAWPESSARPCSALR